MKPLKITYIISSVDKALEFEWVVDYLDKEKFTLSFIILNATKSSSLADYASTKGLDVKLIVYRGKADFILALVRTFLTLLSWRPNLINCHLPEGTLIGLLAGKLAMIRRRFYTRHHSTLNHDYHPHAIKYDRWSNKLATKIIAVSETVKNVLVELEHVNPSKIVVIEHCLDLEKFDQVSSDQKQAVFDRNELPNNKLIIGVIARYTKWKGIQFIIPAFQKLLNEYPDTHLVIANAKKGDYIAEIENLLNGLPANSFTEIEFEKDLYALHQSFDIFVHAPIDRKSEAFGQIYIEALASKTPAVFTLSGIGNEILIDGTNCLVAKHQSSEAIFERMVKLIKNKQLCETIALNGYRLVNNKFSIARKISLLEENFNNQ